jgi:hypothetical protein
MGIACTPLSLWTLTAFHIQAKSLDELPFNGWAAIWALGFVLLCLATWLGSRRWVIGMLFEVVSFLATMTLIFKYFG